MAEHFFLVGAQRCGTTYLHRILDEHPEIAMAKPVVPEPKFFVDDDLYRRGLDWYEKTFFSDTAAGRRGEKSATYLESDLAADRIAASYPGARIVVVLRDPVARAVSNYWFSVDNDLETLPLEEALTADEEARAQAHDGWYHVRGKRVSASPFSYRRRGRYVDDLPRYVTRFGRDNIEILVFEDTVGSSEAIAGLYSFLGADPSFTPPSLHRVINRGRRSRAPLSEGLEQSLRAYYEASNEALAEQYALDLTPWPSNRARLR
jgi:hypothetical protein